MQHLHDLIARMYPGWPASLTGHRVQVHLEDAGTWLHVETDEQGLDSPVKPRAIHHLHISAEWTVSDGSLRRPVALLSVVFDVDARGTPAVTPEALPWSYVVTAWNDAAEDPGSVRRIWTHAPSSGRLICHRSEVGRGLVLLREWDHQIGRRWQP